MKANRLTHLAFLSCHELLCRLCARSQSLKRKKESKALRKVQLCSWTKKTRIPWTKRLWIGLSLHSKASSSNMRTRMTTLAPSQKLSHSIFNETLRNKIPTAWFLTQKSLSQLPFPSWFIKKAANGILVLSTRLIHFPWWVWAQSMLESIRVTSKTLR